MVCFRPNLSSRTPDSRLPNICIGEFRLTLRWCVRITYLLNKLITKPWCLFNSHDKSWSIFSVKIVRHRHRSIGDRRTSCKTREKSKACLENLSRKLLDCKMWSNDSLPSCQSVLSPGSSGLCSPCWKEEDPVSNVVFKHVIKFWPVFTSFVFEQHSTHKSMLPGSSNVSKKFFDNTYILKKKNIWFRLIGNLWILCDHCKKLFIEWGA